MAFTADQLERYSRQLILPELGAAGQKKLYGSKVLVIGAGGLGSVSLMYLAAAGVGTLGIADFDCVELSNLPRQLIHRTDSVGQDKCSSAAETIRLLNPDTEVRLYPQRMTADCIPEHLEGYDFIVDATDRFETKLLINDACVLAGKPYSHAGILGMEGQVMTYVPGEGPCLRCISGNSVSGGSMPTCAQTGVIGAAVGILGSIQALEAIKYLTGTGQLLTGRLLHMNGKTMEFTQTQIPEASPHCRVCGRHPEIVNLAEHREEYEPACGGWEREKR